MYLAENSPVFPGADIWDASVGDDNTVRFWWDDMIQIRVDRSVAVPGNGVFEFASNFKYDENNNVVGIHESGNSDDETSPKLGNPDRDLMERIGNIDVRNFGLLKEHLDALDEDMRVFTALHLSLIHI